ncbi:hypothetical protein OG426_30935 [Streptomyces canus]|uniref:hypothetical protein n=1 Tax=Streptomyces canus TaxID=58343 RepID=UPI002251B2C6|nr:hypothetical protein [Streptomyces canus]MCX4858137.1 hypothetical protein [Streptomyces canus]WSW36547.1 hypothetical protein OG426_30935 [Streptomyces canus]
MVDQSDRSARAALEAWGWQEAGQVHRAPTVLCVLLLPLGERTTEHPDGLGHNARTQRPG